MGIWENAKYVFLFISYYPLKQGLKQMNLNKYQSTYIDLYPTIH